MSNEEPKGSEHHTNAKEKLQKAQESLSIFNNFSVSEFLQTSTASSITPTTATGNIVMTVNANGGFMQQDETLIRPVSERDRIYKAVGSHINESLREERDTLKRKLETALQLRCSLENDNSQLLSLNRALKADARALTCTVANYHTAFEDLEKRSAIQAHNLQELQAIHDELETQHLELKEAHGALRSVVRGLEESDTFNDTVADYEQQVDALNEHISGLETDKAACSKGLEQQRWQITSLLRRIDALNAAQPPAWDLLTHEEKITRMESGMTVWQVSTGEGPFRTIHEAQIKPKNTAEKSEFGMRCRDSKGRERIIEIVDLTPHRPAVVARPSTFKVRTASFISFALPVAVAALTLPLPVVAVVGSFAALVALVNLREFRKV